MQLPFWLCSPFPRLAGVVHCTRQLPSPKGHARTPRPFSAHVSATKPPAPACRLQVEVFRTGSYMVVRLRGEAGVTEMGVLEDSLRALFPRRPAWVTFVLRKLRFLSGRALRVLAANRSAVVRAGARLRLALDPRPALERVKVMGVLRAVGGAEPEAGPEPGAEGVGKLYPSVDDVQRVFGVTWGLVVELEPRVETLLGRARRAGAHCRTLADVDRVFGPLRNELARLIGFAGEHQQHPVLGSDGAFEVAYWKLYNAMVELLPGAARGAEVAPANQRTGIAAVRCPRAAVRPAP